MISSVMLAKYPRHTFELNNLDRIILFTDPEDFKVTEDRLLRLGMTVDFDAKEIALILPVEFAL